MRRAIHGAMRAHGVRRGAWNLILPVALAVTGHVSDGRLDRPIGVLWDVASNEVWVDTDQDRSFADEKPMRDYVETFDHGVLGQDDPDTPVRETIPFAVQTEPEHEAVSLNFGLHSHGTMVSGAVAASRGRSGLFDGIAPGARIVSIFPGVTTHGLIEALIRAFRDARVDVVLLEQNVYVALPYLLGDGRFTATVICSRLIQKYRKPFLVPADNSPGLNTVSEHGLAWSGLSVGAYESRENFFLSRAVRVFHEHNLHWVGSWGPGGNGALKPDIISPSEVLTTYPASAPGESMRGIYDAPPGYAMCGGTSCATPVTAGAVALLISAARQEKVPYDAERLYRAITSSARHLSNIETYKQGNGLIQVGAAWEMLKRLASAEKPVEISSRAPVKTAISAWLDPPHTGPGIYEREGWAPGQTGEREIEFTRISGPVEPMEFRVKWSGNDDSFSSPAAIRLPLKESVKLPVKIAPEFPGVHSALLTLENPQVPGVAHRIMNTVVAAESFGAASGWTLKKELRVPRPGALELFFNVPTGVAALQFVLESPKETVALRFFPPDRREDSVLLPPREATQSRTIPTPMPGVWGVVLPNRNDLLAFDESRPATLPSTPVTLTVSLLGVQLVPETIRPEAPGPGRTREIRLAVRNNYAQFEGTAASVALASYRETAGTLSNREQRVFDITISKGTSRLAVELAGVSKEADLDLYLFDCSAQTCLTRRARVGPDSSEVLSLDHPTAGLWKAVVDGARIPTGHTEFVYRDFISHPKYGSLSVADAIALRPSGISWELRGGFWLAKLPEKNRRLCGVLQVTGQGIASTRFGGPIDLALSGSTDHLKIEPVPLGTAVIFVDRFSGVSGGKGGRGVQQSPADRSKTKKYPVVLRRSRNAQ